MCDCLFPNKKLASVRKDFSTDDIDYELFFDVHFRLSSFLVDLCGPMLVGAYAQEVLLPLGC